MNQPLVGDVESPAIGPNDVPWVLGTQLTAAAGPLARAQSGSRVLLVEAHEFARRLPYHHHKLTLVFAAMRHFRDRLERAGYDVHYVQADSFGEGLERFFEANPDARLVAMESPSYGTGERLRELVAEAGGELRLCENELFCCTKSAFDEWAAGESGFTHERFYRWMRAESGVLMTDEEPVGGDWNYDDENRETPPDDWAPPPVPDLAIDDLTEETAHWVAAEFDTWGASEGFHWPVTRDGALEWLEHVIAERLPAFGPYQDAMHRDEWAMSHTLLSPAINLGLLHPVEVIDRVETAVSDRDDVPLSSAEGLIRQLIGWREFLRHVYRHTMPELARANRLEATRDLPDAYWTGETEMRCLEGCVEDVHARGYAHHIQRLMILANFATLWGVDPADLNEWFHATFVDAYHWVTTPNVIEMGSYAHGAFATKPYVSSANYVEKMSNYCADCAYDPNETTGAGACPFNALYWDFLARNEDDLRSNHRMGLMYSHVDRKRESGDLEAIEERVDDLRTMAESGDL